MNVAIVGAGIAGCSIARALVARGITPTVYSYHRGSTDRGAGIVSAQFWDKALLPLARRSQEIIRSLVPVHECGMAQIALSQKTAQPVTQLGRTELPAELASCFRPSFLRQIRAVSFSPTEFWIDNTRLREVMLEGCTTIHEEVSIESLKADRIVDATNRNLAGTWGEEAWVRPCTLSLPTMFHVLDTGLYARPSHTGSLAGNGDPNHIVQVLASVLRQPFRCREARSGIVRMTKTGHPIVRRRGHVWTITGLGGDGLVLAPALGECIAEKLIR